jgi:CheY-like chemotaxis protein
VLESVGYCVLIAEDGATGYQMALNHQPDLILMDINLPDEDGYRVTERLLDTTAFRKVPIVLLWAGMSRNRPSSFMGQHVMPKPIDIDVLLETVPRLLAENASE